MPTGHSQSAEHDQNFDEQTVVDNLLHAFYQQQVHLKQLEYNEKGQYFVSHISESETHILYRFITKSERFQAFIS